jgi:hypothetical protein
MGELLQFPVPRTPDGAHKLGVALGAQFRAERWARLRRTASLVALGAGGAVVVDATFAFLGPLVRRALVAAWWVALATAVLAGVVEIWATLRLHRLVVDLGRDAAASEMDRR